MTCLSLCAWCICRCTFIGSQASPKPVPADDFEQAFHEGLDGTTRDSEFEAGTAICAKRTHPGRQRGYEGSMNGVFL